MLRLNGVDRLLAKEEEDNNGDCEELIAKDQMMLAAYQVKLV